MPGPRTVLAQLATARYFAASSSIAPFGDGPAAEMAAFAGTMFPVFAVFADDNSLAAFGPNPLDPRCRIASALAGREQGRREAAAVARFLGA